MANKFYDPGEGRGARVNDLFAAIAPRYDLINDLQSLGMHRLWKRRLIGLAAPRPGETALDLCCGTGDIAFGLAARGARVMGLDFSGAMLRVADLRSRARTTPGEAPKFIQGDAMRTGLPSGAFDVVTIGYGLRNLSSWEQGLAEIQRVAKPGGRVLVLDFGKPDSPAWRQAYFAYLRWVVPRFGKVFCGDSETHSYILESLLHYPAQRGVERRMRELGWSGVEVFNLLGGMMSINYGRTPGGE
ncbi:MAG TPA: bifunctional demethylmenaquinone methyltransferase/2-methoxy-6-polyprenyl-1,4-benzoquinol methylase UbiE [Verrucomicrobiales bacterium]|nr:bifunctional demethylmenaquinone methyltransferase/2-methoxy-6-polyprenyl-1,4-benzoquinol methylase UbiE [Verrucomicrobiales bacterium]